jgi:XTP/dITP diphosphohydrolase
VAGGLVEKMVRRNPHVFADDTATTIDEITENWERIKREEKSRDSVLDGIALTQPALSLAAKVLQRAERAGISAATASASSAPPASPSLPSAVPPSTGGEIGAGMAVPLAPDFLASEAVLGDALLRIVGQARVAGLDAEAALRRATLDYAERVRAAEQENVGPPE